MDKTKQIIDIARQAMLLEAVAYPKPGLVDPMDSGSHDDMDIMTFIMSSNSMDQEWALMYQAGCKFQGKDLSALFGQIRPLGLAAERQMLKATNGINTHKGVIFSLGIIVSAIGYLNRHRQLNSVDDILETVKQMMTHVLDDFQGLENKPLEQLSHGERLYLKYNVQGIRREAYQGFPIVQAYALPYLREAGELTNEAILDTLILIMKHCEDTNLIKRAGDIKVLDYAKSCTNEYFALGGAKTPDGQDYLTNLNQTFIAKNLSIGGSADLLTISIFLYLYEMTQISTNKPE
jgi:triphosphoribosyl-dephospho-CoA synthase